KGPRFSLCFCGMRVSAQRTMATVNMSRDRLLTAVRVLVADSDDEQVVEALVASGFERLQSEILAAFGPLAFGRALLERVAAIDFPATVWAKTQRGKWVRISLHDVPVYGAALALARECFTTGIVPRDSYEA